MKRRRTKKKKNRTWNDVEIFLGDIPRQKRIKKLRNKKEGF